MKSLKLSMFVLLLAGGMALFLGSCSKESNFSDTANSTKGELKAGNTPSANGQGSLVVNSVVRHFSFRAITKQNGTVEGSGVLNYNGNGNIQIKFSIDCLNVAGNMATMSGAVTASNDEVWPVGTPVSFRVLDNGEGSGSDPDQITLLQQSFGYDCYTWPGLPLNPITAGNIQVKP
jgi:hypothetical protein